METIFLVDDDPGVLKALARAVRAEAWNVETFESAEAFLARPDPQATGCLVLDVTMSGLDGLELQRQLTQDGQPLPIVFLTGDGDIPMSVQVIKAGAADFLTKPVNINALRHNDITEQMRSVARQLTSEEIATLAAYYASFASSTSR